MFATINGIDIYYEDSGQGTAIVFIHGLGENTSSWHHQLSYFSQGYRVVAMDLRGHGQSSFNDEFITIELLACDILSLMDYLRIDYAHFVGHSMGGLICQEIASHNSGRMLSMVLSDSAGYYPPPMGTTGLETRLKNIDNLTMAEMAEIIANGACRPGALDAVKAEVRNLFAANRKEPYRQATISTLKADYRKYHNKMLQPTLVMVGEYDKTTPLEYAEFLNSVLVSSKLTVIPDAAHMTKLENPKEYNRLVDEFLQGIK